MTTPGMNDDLAGRIRQKQAQLEAFLGAARPRKRRLLNTTIWAGTLAAALTAAPAAGGQAFTGWLTKLLGLASPSWRVLCAAASVCSILATVATQLLKSSNIEEQVARSQACRAKLELLETSLAMGQIDERQALAEYMKSVEETAFLDVV